LSYVDFKGFWRWCMMYRTIRFILDFIHRLVYMTKNHNVSETGSVSVRRWMGPDPVSEMWFFVIYTRRRIKSKINLIVLYSIHHCQNPSKSIYNELVIRGAKNPMIDQQSRPSLLCTAYLMLPDSFHWRSTLTQVVSHAWLLFMWCVIQILSGTWTGLTEVFIVFLSLCLPLCRCWNGTLS
jgi:hypothetical protein